MECGASAESGNKRGKKREKKIEKKKGQKLACLDELKKKCVRNGSRAVVIIYRRGRKNSEWNGPMVLWLGGCDRLLFAKAILNFCGELNTYNILSASVLQNGSKMRAKNALR